ARSLSFAYDETPLFSGVSFSLAEGEWVAITGPSGSGKSTLCLLASGVIPRSLDVGKAGGEVLLFGEDIAGLSLAKVASQLGLMLQEPDSQLFSPLVEDEIAFGPENLCLPRDEIGERIERALRLTGMNAKRMADTDALSGGQKQLIALAAVLAMEPRVLILDEAFAMLDEAAEEQMLQVLRCLKAQGTAILTVEHEPRRLAAADRILRLDAGRLEEVGL
ncbi:MAG: ABC transporter ATP-binding protein, partial [Firmicutes bacterium]|nr:ABC transporter ATP-binding protein [Bacillota bacterium]